MTAVKQTPPMSVRCLALFTCLVAAGCSQPPNAYQHPRNIAIALLGGELFGERPCYRTIDGEPGILPDKDCYRFGEPRRMQGIANFGFETASFYSGRTSLPDQAKKPVPWMNFDLRQLDGDAATIARRCNDGCVVYLDFIGRQTVVEGGYGYMGMAKHKVIADRVLSVRYLDLDGS